MVLKRSLVVFSGLDKPISDVDFNSGSVAGNWFPWIFPNDFADVIIHKHHKELYKRVIQWLNQYDMNILLNCNLGSKLKLSSGSGSGQYDSVLRHIDLLKKNAACVGIGTSCLLGLSKALGFSWSISLQARNYAIYGEYIRAHYLVYLLHSKK